MKVIDVIIRLQQLDPNLPVVIDSTRENAKAFHFTDLANVDEVVTSDNQKIVMLSPFEYEEEQNDN
jgi:hypothetical protein